MILKNKKILASAVSLLFLFILLVPVLTSAELIKCGVTSAESDGKPGGGCDFTDLIVLINDIIKWIISIATSIFTIMAVYGGFLYMTSGTSIGDKEKARKILWSTITGFIIILCSWLIVYTLLNILIPSDSSSVYRKSIFEFISNGN
jgi:hypothetical protein